MCVRILSRGTLRDYWQSHGDAEQPLKAWYQEAKKASWNDPHEIKEQYRTASILRSSKVVFNIAGNKYRLVVSVSYRLKIVFIKFIGTHADYEKLNLEEL